MSDQAKNTELDENEDLEAQHNKLAPEGDVLRVVESTDPNDPDNNQPAASLGLDRWVQFAFIAVAVTLAFVLDKVINLVWDRLAANFDSIPDPSPAPITAVATIVGFVTAILLYRGKTRTLVEEVVAELNKVTWPTREETRNATVVVVVTSLFAAFLTGTFDFVWSKLTDLIYNR